MYKEKLLFLLSYCLIPEYSPKFSYTPKFIKPLFLIFGDYAMMALGGFILLSYLYLFFSSILKPYGNRKAALIPILIVFTLSVLMEFKWLFKFTDGWQLYFLLAIGFYFFSAFKLYKGLQLNDDRDDAFAS